MPLEHISMWTERGWKHVTPREAAKVHPNGASRESKQFLCETCVQYAAFANRAYYFTHGRNSEDCTDKSTSDYYLRNHLHFSLPLKVEFDGKDLEISIGFPSPSAQQMKTATALGAYITIECKKGDPLLYLINEDRFQGGITYLPIGNEICYEYRVSVSHSIPQLGEIWPPIVRGFVRSSTVNGTLFDEKTGRRLPAGAGIAIQRPMLLVTWSFVGSHHPDVQVDFIIELKHGWRIYRVTAQRLSQDASDFLIQYGAMLTDVPMRITPIWPPALMSSHTVLNPSPWLMLISRGGGCAEVYPPPKILRHYPIPGSGAQLHLYRDAGMQHVLTLSRFDQRGSVQQFLIMNQGSPDEHCSIDTNVQICDDNDYLYTTGTFKRLPPKRQLYVTANFDGWIDVWMSGRHKESLRLCASQAITTVPVEWQTDIRIYQGLDLCVQLRFAGPAQCEDAQDDNALLHMLSSLRGRMIPFPHISGTLANRMQHLPKTTCWVRKQIRVGQISDVALNYLLKKVGRH